jgi:hypothetical protein
MTIVDEVWKNTGVTSANIRDIIKIARLAHNAHDVKLITRTMFGTRRNQEADRSVKD